MREKKYVLFGAGEYGRRGIRYLVKDKISFFIDNDKEKIGKEIEDIPICSLEEVKEDLDKYILVLTVAKDTEREIINQLKANGISDYMTLGDECNRIIKRRLHDSKKNLVIYQKAVNWILSNTLNGQAMCYVAGRNGGYPEVTGYFIPSLIQWGYRELASSYAHWLCSVQQEDGSWGTEDGKKSFIFDTGQVLKGLLAIRKQLPEVKRNVLKACEWICSKVTDEGRLPLLDENAWGKGVIYPEFVHIYCLSPLQEAGEVYGIIRFKETADKVLNFYKTKYRTEILNFDRLTHFQAYILEGLFDLGETELAREGMKVMSDYLDKLGYVPAYKNVDWVCSTGLFQLAIVWFKLGDLRRGNKAFSYACRLQNESGGWYGSYPVGDSLSVDNDYFPFEEISWAEKFFLDALQMKQKAEFIDIYEGHHPLEKFYNIEKNNELYMIICNSVTNYIRVRGKEGIKVLDVGCGWGRYLRKLALDFSTIELYGVELLEKPLEFIKEKRIHKDIGSLTNIPFDSAAMDIVYTCEALEHVVDVKSAIKEMARVTRPHGLIIVIDKNLEAEGKMKIMEWEQYFDEDELKSYFEEFCYNVRVVHGLHADKNRTKSFFSAWIGYRK